MSLETFIAKSVAKHGPIYDYSKVVYVNSTTKVEIVCKKHGSFWQAPGMHVFRSGCPKCSYEYRANKLRMDIHEFLEKSRNMHGNKYDYSLVSNYKDSKSVVSIICRLHGPFQQVATAHVQGRGCQKCGEDAGKDVCRMSLKDFILKAKNVHGNTYDYSEVDYIKSTLPVKIKCLACDSYFLQRPDAHTNQKQGCPDCGKAKSIITRTDTLDAFIKKATQIHQEKYDYRKAVYVNSQTKIIIDCHIHGEFRQIPAAHLNGQGCPACSGSAGENSVADFLATLNTDIKRRDRSLFPGQHEVDFYLPDHCLAVEYNGLFWHSATMVNYSRDMHWVENHQLEKLNICMSKGVSLLHIYEDEWLDNRQAVEELLRWYIFPKCSVADEELLIKREEGEAIDFFNTYHLFKAPTESQCYYVVKNQKESIAAIAISIDKQTCNIARFLEKSPHTGCLSILLGRIIEEYPHLTSVTYTADRRLDNGVSFSTVGFNIVSHSRPTYQYTNNRAQRFSLEDLVKKFPDKYNPNLSERENCHNLGFYQIFNCGLTKWELIL